MPDRKQTGEKSNFTAIAGKNRMLKSNRLSKLVLAGLLFAVCTLANAQHKTVGIVFAPTDKAVGVRIDREISKIGYYGSATWGNYRFLSGAQLKDHVKLSGGLVKYSPNRNHRFTTLFSVGMAYHTYGELTGEFMDLPSSVFKKVSGDVGIGFRVDHLNVGWCVDPFKKEVAVNFGISFN